MFRVFVGEDCYQGICRSGANSLIIFFSLTFVENIVFSNTYLVSVENSLS
jgi:hypothetical protein